MEPVIIKNIGVGVRVGYSGKTLGNTHERFSKDAIANFAKFKASFAGKTVYDMPAVGGDNIIEIDGMTPKEVFDLETDGLITKQPSALLTLRAADCIPLVFYVPGQKILALAHVGTRGAALHLPCKMVKRLGEDPGLLRVYVGPSISQKSYLFPPDYDFDNKALDSSWDSYKSQEPDGIHINLLGYVLDELKSCGIADENTEVEKVDTGGDQKYFSHRRHNNTGEPDGRNSFGVCLI